VCEVNLKVTLKQVRNICKDLKEDPVRLKATLRRVFSFPENIVVFSQFFFRTYASAPPAKFHSEIYDFLFEPNDGAIAAPRSHSKSTITGLFFISFCIVNNLEKYIVYISENHTKTTQFIEPIRTQFKTNPLIKFVYGDFDLNNTKDEEGRDREDCFDVNGLRIEGVSFEKNLRGFKYKESRPTLIILDDIENDERVLNPELRYKDENKLNKVIIPSLDPVTGKIKFIGTILHWDSLLIKKIRLYDGKIYKACDENLNNSLWPEYWTKERLMNKKKSIGSVAFASEFFNNPIESDSSIIKSEWIDACCDDSISYNETYSIKEYSYLGCDFAFGDRVTNDKSAFVGIIGLQGKKIINEIYTYKGVSITEQFEIIKNLYDANLYEEIIMEENSIKSMSTQIYNYNFPYYLIWTGSTDTANKLKPDIPFEAKRHTVGKRAMVLRMATEFENKIIRLPFKTDKDKEITNRLKDELLTFALNDGKLVEVGVHADIPIGLAMALERANDNNTIMDL